jgi:hypothetical protein
VVVLVELPVGTVEVVVVCPMMVVVEAPGRVVVEEPGKVVIVGAPGRVVVVAPGRVVVGAPGRVVVDAPGRVVVVGAPGRVVEEELDVVVTGPAQVPSAAQASNVLNRPREAPQAFPFLHLVALPTIDALTFPLALRMQHTAAVGFPQVDAFSHRVMSLRHAFWGMSAVRSASRSVAFTHFVYLRCVWPARVQPQVAWMVARARSMAVVSPH